METVFSVYQLNIEFIEEYMEKTYLQYDKDLKGMQHKKSIIDFIMYKIYEDNAVEKDAFFETNDSYIYVYQKNNRAPWEQMILHEYNKKRSGQDLSNIELENISVSYIMFTPINENIYISTGGYASSLIKPYVNSKFGLHLVTRLFKGDEQIIKQSTNEFLSGTTVSESSINREYLSFNIERDYAKFFRNISADTSANLMKKIGLDFDEDKNIRIESSDSFKVNKNLSYDEYYKMLTHIDKVIGEKPNFSLSYFIPVNDIDVQKKTVFNKMIDYIIERPESTKEILLTTNNNYNYQMCTLFTLRDVEGNEIKSQQTPFSFQELIALLVANKNKRLNKTMLKELLYNWQLEAVDDKGYNIVLDYKIRDLLQFNFRTSVVKEKYRHKEIMSNNDWFYLNSGDWYVLDRDYLSFIQDEYVKTLQSDMNKLDKLYKEKDLLSHQVQSETNYHNQIKGSEKNTKEFYVADKKLVNNVEICDVMTFDEDHIYLIGNKSKPTGIGCRDLFNQLESSMILISNKGKAYVFSNLYKQLHNESIDHQFKKEEDFIDFVNQKAIVYVAVFTKESLKEDSKSMYCKLLLLQLKRNMKKHDFNFYIYDPNIKQGEEI